ncbi:GNAT family N-acetyltransferase [Nocardia sp. NPDC058114]|uniref:GNAT family N-acetyltransferase n=1 Tax=Nocardia sp. NPDC058114 TaxID=3346346 RepID=UPI0036D904E7
MIIDRAVSSDVEQVLAMRSEAAAWLRRLGTDQWSVEPDGFRTHVLAGIEAGETWMLREGSETVATITIDSRPDPLLWTADEQAESASYLKRLIVRRSHAGCGLGAQLLKWGLDRSANIGVSWYRCDVWTTNIALQDYYRRLGFTLVRAIARDDLPSSALFQRRPLEAAHPIFANRDDDHRV